MIEILVKPEGAVYPVRIGSGELASMIAGAVSMTGSAGAVAVLSDRNVFPLHGEAVMRGVRDAGAEPASVLIEPGEGSKTLGIIEYVAGEMLRAGLDRRSVLVALGGGVVGDVGGLAAALFMRGIPVVQAPTSLLAQVDASVGGKTAVNHPLCKNLVGVFHRPSAVVVDPLALSTLPAAELSSGMAEAVKHAVLSGAEHVGWMEANAARLLTADPEALGEAVLRSVRFKAAVVGADENDTRGVRASLNLGHTVGHALETIKRGAIRHGEAVSIGMIAACRIAERVLGFHPRDTAQLAKLLASFGLPVRIPGDVAVDEVLAVAAADKKRSAGEISWVLPSTLGHVEIVRGISQDLVLSALRGT